MKRRLCAALLCLICLSLAALAEAGGAPDFAALTGLDAFNQSVEAGGAIASVSYSDGTGDPLGAFTSADANEIAALFAALNRMEIAGPAGDAADGTAARIAFELEDGARLEIAFAGQALEAGGARFALENDLPFRLLISKIADKYAHGGNACRK